MSKVIKENAVCHFCEHALLNDDEPCDVFPERKLSDLYPNGLSSQSAFPDCQEFTYE